jgi:hypothetical protein
MDSLCFSVNTGIIFLNSVNQLMFVMVTGCVLFQVLTEFLKYYLDKSLFQRVKTLKNLNMEHKHDIKV